MIKKRERLLLGGILVGFIFSNPMLLQAKEKAQKEAVMEKIEKSDDEWKKTLTPEQYYITRQQGTERPFTGKYVHNKEKGMYRCVACGLELFSSDTKFDSKTGWPSFWDPVAKQNLRFEEDSSHGMRRIEVRCARCGAHLGHLFDDGPTPTGQRYCINSCALEFQKKQDGVGGHPRSGLP